MVDWKSVGYFEECGDFKIEVMVFIFVLQARSGRHLLGNH
jgi:hypothetical protein